MSYDLREGETRDDSHAQRNLQALQDAAEEGIDADASIAELTADRETFRCARCDRVHFSRGAALRCCSDGGGEGGEPA